jgi:hypothetical protein
MQNAAGSVNLGVILCKHCLEVIDTLDTEGVVTYYSDCQEPHCLENRKQSQVEQQTVQV